MNGVPSLSSPVHRGTNARRDANAYGANADIDVPGTLGLSKENGGKLRDDFHIRMPKTVIPMYKEVAEWLHRLGVTDGSKKETFVQLIESAHAGITAAKKEEELGKALRDLEDAQARVKALSNLAATSTAATDAPASPTKETR